MIKSSLVTYNPISQNDPRKRTNCVGQLSVEKFTNKTRKTGCSFAVGFENNTLIVQRFPKVYMNG